MPFAPHIAEEIWSSLRGEGFVSLSTWPAFEEEMEQEKELTIGVQINGKTRSSISCLNSTSESEALKAAKEKTAVQKALKGKTVKKVIYKAGRILNIITN